MGSMKIININSRTVKQVDFALPFETDDQVTAAWEHIFVHHRGLLDFSYRPAADGEDPDRYYIESFLEGHCVGTVMPLPDAGTIRRLIPKLFQAELGYDIRELLGVCA
jgi:hypothetical protein